MNVTVPLKAPDCIPAGFDEELFDLCRDDDYRGLYEALIRRVIESGKDK